MRPAWPEPRSAGLFRRDHLTAAGHRSPRACAANYTALYRLLHSSEVLVHVEDITAEDANRSGNADRRRFAELTGARTAVWVALRKDDAVLGALVIYRQEVRPFTDQQISLLQNFAAQAVIAIKNARLLGELRERTDEVAELNRGLEARIAEQVD